MKNTLETRLGMFVLLAIIAGIVIVEILGAQDILKPGYHLRAQFNNIQDLKVGDPVKMAGVPVGRVEKIKLAQSKVELRLKLDKDAPVHTDSKATIKFTGLMGQYYVAVDFGTMSAPQMEPDGLLTTTEQPDLSALVAKLDDVATGVQNLTKSFSGDKIDNLLGPFTAFMKENNERIGAIIANVKGISDQVASGKGTIGKVIYDDALYNSAYATVTNLQHSATEANEVLAQARSVVEDAKSGKGTVGKLLTDDTLYKDTAATMAAAKDAVQAAKEILQTVNSGQGSVGKLVKDQEFYRNAKLSLQKLDKATESLEDSGPLSLLGQIITTLF